MPLRNSWNSRAIRTALVEPCGADAYWFNLMAEESGCTLAVTQYSTGLGALTEWKRVSSAFDLIVVPDILPMLTVEEFIQIARSLHPYAMIVVVRGGASVLSSEAAGYASYPKPLTVDAIREMVLRVTPDRVCGAQGQRVKNSASFSLMPSGVYMARHRDLTDSSPSRPNESH
jgi:hypothetical protein